MKVRDADIVSYLQQSQSDTARPSSRRILVCGTEGDIISACKLTQTKTAFSIFNNFGRLVWQSDLAEMH
jgi:hypothetical protein